MTPVIEVDRLRREFGSFVAVDDVSFSVPAGEIFGWLGANGAGKSTTIRMLIGVLEPTAGDATVAGASIRRDPVGVKRRIGYMSQRFSLYPDLTVRENMEFFGGAYGLWGRHLRDRIAAVSRDVDLVGLLSAKTADLPGGTRQRVALATSLLQEPAIVFLDEPTAGVDPLSRRMFWDLIRALAAAGTTVFVTTHHLDEAEECGRVGLMVDGKLVALDTPAALARDHVPGTIWRARAVGIHAAAAGLRARPGVLEVEPFGAELHVRVDGVPQAAVDAWLRPTFPDLKLDLGKATLEDVFLAVVGRKEPA